MDLLSSHVQSPGFKTRVERLQALLITGHIVCIKQTSFFKAAKSLVPQVVFLNLGVLMHLFI